MNAEKQKIYFYIDVVGTCNLRCPSCPVGNSTDVVNERGVMSPITLDHILEKATSECSVTSVGLFNWTEPLLHPRLDEMVRVVKKYGLRCAVSTNLNINKPGRYRKLLESNPFLLRISLSGLSQEKYGITHKGGSIVDVLSRMETLAQLKEETGSTTHFAVTFHRYLSNLDEESKLKEYCENLGFIFQPVNARMHPLEKVLAYCGESSFSPISQEDEEIIANLALPLKQALASASQVKTLSCKLLEDQVTLNWKGDASLCCAAYDEKKFLVGNYMENSLESIQTLRRSHAACATCNKHGASNYFLANIPDMESLADENIRLHC